MMNAKAVRQTCFAALFLLCILAVTPALSAIKKIALITSTGTRLENIELTELTKLFKGAQKSWPDGRNFLPVMKDPESPEMRPVVQRFFGTAPAEARAAISKLNDLHAGQKVVRIVASDEEVLGAVAATPGAIGVVDVYAINSSVKVLRLDGKLPFDAGYVLKGD